MTKVAVYTSCIGNFDWIHRPRVKPAGIDFLRFADRRPLRLAAWQHRDAPPLPDTLSTRLRSRFPKLCPHGVLKGYDVGIWIDSNVEVVGDLTPAIDAFQASGADIGLFPHPSGRTVDEEFDFAIAGGRIAPAFYEAAERQRARYGDAGVLDQKIVEATIIFYRLPSEVLRAAGEAWWNELEHYTERDQVSQPFAMRDRKLRIHAWDWHFDDPNPYFRRLPHRPKTFLERLKTGSHFMSDSRLDFRLIHSALRANRWVRERRRALFSRSD